jgi:hypothetical protein
MAMITPVTHATMLAAALRGEVVYQTGVTPAARQPRFCPEVLFANSRSQLLDANMLMGVNLAHPLSYSLTVIEMGEE